MTISLYTTPVAVTLAAESDGAEGAVVESGQFAARHEQGRLRTPRERMLSMATTPATRFRGLACDPWAVDRGWSGPMCDEVMASARR